MNIRGKACTITYSVFDTQTGLPITGDTGHTVELWNAAGTRSILDVTPTEYAGTYSFQLAATYTDTTHVTIRITPTTTGAAVRPIVYRFTDASDLIPKNQDVYTAIFDAVTVVLACISESETRLTAELTDLGTGVSGVSALLTTTLAPHVEATYTKLLAYPVGSDLALKSDIPTVEAITTSLLTTGCDDTLAANAGAFSLVSLIMASFQSSFDFATNTWIITQPDGSTLLTRSITTQTGVPSIVEVGD